MFQTSYVGISIRSTIAADFLGGMSRRAKSENYACYAMDALMDCAKGLQTS